MLCLKFLRDSKEKEKKIKFHTLKSEKNRNLHFNTKFLIKRLFSLLIDPYNLGTLIFTPLCAELLEFSLERNM